MQPKKVSKLLLTRLNLYLDLLNSLPDDIVNISATTIARELGLGEVQVRKDLARVSGGGKCKTGHVRSRLIQDIEEMLHFGDTTPAIVIGSGRLGQALLAYPGFEAAGIRLVAGFDILSKTVSSDHVDQIYPMDQLEAFCRLHNIQIGIITVPKEAAQEACDLLISCGIRAIWNFSPAELTVPENILLRNENLAFSLATLRVELKNKQSSGSQANNAPI